MIEPLVALNRVKFLLPNDARWYAVDEDGNTIVHHLAVRHNTTALYWFVSHNKHLLQQRNDEGEIALEALQSHLEAGRTHTEGNFTTHHISDEFIGYNDDAVHCLMILHFGPNVHVDNDTRLRLKYGCTCGICLHGFFSPRMHFKLTHQASTQSKAVKASVSAGLDVATFQTTHKHLLYSISPRFRSKLTGHLEFIMRVVDLFGDFLFDPFRANPPQVGKWPTKLPSLANIQKHCVDQHFWHESLREMFREDSSLHQSLGWGIMSFAMLQDDVVGGGSMPAELFIDTSPVAQQWAQIYHNLPVCRNDLEYGLVSSMLGFGKVAHKTWFMKGFLDQGPQTAVANSSSAADS